MYDTNYIRAYNNKNIRTSGLISAGEYQDDKYGYFNCTRPSTSGTFCCYAFVRYGQYAFGLGYNSSNQIVLGSSTTAKSINPWIYITSGGVHTNGYVSALGQNSSDARLKTNIQDFNATSLIKQLHPKSFEWNDLAKSKFEVFRNTGMQYGLIAQDVKEVMPEWVDDNLIGSGYMGIRYDKLIPVLLQGEIETISRVETLEDKVRRLEKENYKLKKKVKELERRAA